MQRLPFILGCVISLGACRAATAPLKAAAAPTIAGTPYHTPSKLTYTFRRVKEAPSDLNAARSAVRLTLQQAQRTNPSISTLTPDKRAGEATYGGADPWSLACCYGEPLIVIPVLPDSNVLYVPVKDYSFDDPRVLADVQSDAAAILYDFSPSFVPAADGSSRPFSYAVALRREDIIDVEGIRLFTFALGPEATNLASEVPALRAPHDLMDALQIAFDSNSRAFQDIGGMYARGRGWSEIVPTSVDLLGVASRNYQTALLTAAGRSASDLAGAQSFFNALKDLAQTQQKERTRRLVPSKVPVDPEVLRVARQQALVSPDAAPTDMAALAEAMAATIAATKPTLLANLQDHFSLFNYTMAATIAQGMNLWEPGPAPAAAASDADTPDTRPADRDAAEKSASSNDRGADGVRGR